MANKNRCSKASLVLFFLIALGDPGKAGKKTQIGPGGPGEINEINEL